MVGAYLGKVVIRMLSAPLSAIMAFVTCLCAIGAFSIFYRYEDIYLMFLFGILGLIIKKWFSNRAYDFGNSCGGNLVDANFRRALLAGKGSFLPFVNRPISIVLIIIPVFLTSVI